MKQSTRIAAKGRWVSILTQLGIDKKYLQNKHGECPVCSGTDRFRFDNKDGNGTFYCSHCQPGDGMKLAMLWTGQSFKDTAAQIDKLIGNAKEDDDKPQERNASKIRAALRRYGSELKTLGDIDPVTKYLRGRGIRHIPKGFIKLHPATPYFEDGTKYGNYPTMVVPFRDVNGQIQSFHRTYLTSDGAKARVTQAKKAMTPIHSLNGCALRLSDIAEHIGIAEGIETALSVTELYGIPCWATYSAHGMEAFVPPAGVKKVTIYSDSDQLATGQRAAFNAMFNLQSQYKIEATVADLLPIGEDFNDVLLRRIQP